MNYRGKINTCRTHIQHCRVLILTMQSVRKCPISVKTSDRFYPGEVLLLWRRGVLSVLLVLLLTPESPLALTAAPRAPVVETHWNPRGDDVTVRMLKKKKKTSKVAGGAFLLCPPSIITKRANRGCARRLSGYSDCHGVLVYFSLYTIILD